MASKELLTRANVILGSKVRSNYLGLLAGHPNLSTREDIRRLLESKGVTATKQLIENLFEVVEKAKELLAEALQKNQITPVSIEPETPAIDQIAPPKSESPASEPVQPPQPTPEEIKKSKIAPKASLADLAAYLEVNFLPAKQAAVIEVDQDVMSLVWKPQNKKSTVWVIAASSTDFPRNVATAEERWIVRQTAAEIQAGDLRFFSIFEYPKEGEEGDLIAQARVLPEVKNLLAEALADQVRLTWDVDELGDELRISVAKSKPNKPLAKTVSMEDLLEVESKSRIYIDTNVKPGDTYEYKVFVVWQGPNKQLFETPGLTQSIEIPASIGRLEHFEVTKVDNAQSVVIEYTTPILGEVRIYHQPGLPSEQLRSAHASDQDFESARLESGEFEWIGRRVIGNPTKDKELSRFDAPMLAGAVGSITYVAVTVLGSKSKVSGLGVVPQVGEITELNFVHRHEYSLLRVGKPEGATHLDVWEFSEGSFIDLDNLGQPNRRVSLEFEYRQFGGVVLADGITSVPMASHLGSEPKILVVRGVSSWNGKDTYGPAKKIDYPGRMVFRHRMGPKASVAEETKKKGWFGGKSDSGAAAPGRAVLEYSFDAGYQGMPVRLHHIAASRAFPTGIDDSINVPVEPTDFLAEDTHGQYRRIGLDYQMDLIHRFIPINSEALTKQFVALDETRIGEKFLPEPSNAHLRVVLIGAKRSGKTTYLQALLNYLRYQLADQMGAAMFAVNDEDLELSELKLSQMEDFVLKGNLPPGTQTARPFHERGDAGEKSSLDPRRTFRYSFLGKDSHPIQQIDFVDVAGEDMDAVETMEYYGDKIRNCDLLIFLVDPLQLPSVKLALAGLPLPAESASPMTALLNLQRVLSAPDKVKNQNQRVAFVVSKFDGIEKLSERPKTMMSGLLTPGMALQRDPFLMGNLPSKRFYEDHEGVKLDRETRAVFRKLGAEAFVNFADANFPNNRFFVVSSLGHATHKMSVDAAGISSFRISDPIRWAAS